MRSRHMPKRAFFAHAARVAAVTTLLIGIVYVAFVVTFDIVDTHHLVAQVDSNLQDRLTDATRQGRVISAPQRGGRTTMTSIRHPSSCGKSSRTDVR